MTTEKSVLTKRMEAPYSKFIVYSDGRVFNSDKERFLPPFMINSGYRCVHLRVGGIDHKRLIHRLVAESFIENPHNYNRVDHIDGNRLNNDYKNLRWVSQEMNLLAAQLKGVSPDRSMHPYEIWCRRTGEVFIFPNFKQAIIYSGTSPTRYIINEKLRKNVSCEYQSIPDTEWKIRIATEMSITDYQWTLE